MQITHILIVGAHMGLLSILLNMDTQMHNMLKPYMSTAYCLAYFTYADRHFILIKIF